MRDGLCSNHRLGDTFDRVLAADLDSGPCRACAAADDSVVQAANHLDAIDPDTVIWRYLTLPKFSKLVSLRNGRGPATAYGRCDDARPRLELCVRCLQQSDEPAAPRLVGKPRFHVPMNAARLAVANKPAACTIRSRPKRESAGGLSSSLTLGAVRFGVKL
jgi:hypothetical protein